MTDLEIISDSGSVLPAISGLVFLNAKIAWVEVDFVVKIVLLSCTRIFHYTELK